MLLRSSGRPARNSKFSSDENPLFNDVRIILIMMQVLDATETYVMRERKHKGKVCVWL
jgi:hypothetical protein